MRKSTHRTPIVILPSRLYPWQVVNSHSGHGVVQHLADATPPLRHAKTWMRVKPSASESLDPHCHLGPVHTSNIVEATFDFVEATFDFVATNGNNVERFYCKNSSFRQSRNKLNMFNLFRKQIEHVQFVSKQIEHVQFVSTLSKGRNFVRHCCRNRQHYCLKRQQCRSNIRHCRKNRSTCSVRLCCFDIVASMDGA